MAPAANGIADSGRLVTVIVALADLAAFGCRGVAVASRSAQLAAGSVRQVLAVIALADALITCRVTVTETVFVAVRSRPAQLALALVVGRARTVAVDALFEAGPFAEGLPVTNVALLAGADVGTGRVETGSVGVAVVLTQGALVDVGTLSVGPVPREGLLHRRGHLSNQNRTVSWQFQTI